MTMKDKILHYFRDINYVYNDCRKYDTLKAMLDEMELELCADCISREDALMALTGVYTDSPGEILPKAIKRISKLQSKTAIKKGEEPDETDDRK